MLIPLKPLYRAFIPAALFAALLATSFLGLFTRYIADDFCMAADTTRLGVWGNIKDIYETWNGRFAHIFVASNIALLGAEIAPYIPALLLGVWVLGTVWIVSQIGQIFLWRHRRFAVLSLSFLFVYAVILGTPNTIQALYWIPGVVTYIVPLIFLTYFTGFAIYFVRRSNTTPLPYWTMVVVFIAMFIAAGFSETNAALNAILLLLAGIGAYLWLPTPYRRSALLLIGAALIGTIIGTLIVIAAPGNAVRRAAFPPSPELPQLIVMSFQFGVTALAYSFLMFNPVGLPLSFIMGGVVAFKLHDETQVRYFKRRLIMPSLLLSGLIAFGILMILGGLSFYATAGGPPPRAFTVHTTVLVLLAFIWGYLMGLGIKQDDLPRRTLDKSPAVNGFVMFIVGLIIVLGPMRQTYQAIAALPDYQIYLDEWHNRDEQLRTLAQTTSHAEIEPLSVDLDTLAGLKAPTDDPAVGVNVCMAEYYGLDTVTVRQP